MDKRLEIQPGELRHMVQIVLASSQPDAVTGQPSATTAAVRTTRAGIYTSSTKQFFFANTFGEAATHMLTMRWTPTAVLPGMSVLFGARTFNVLGVENVQQRNVRLNLLCSEVIS